MPTDSIENIDCKSHRIDALKSIHFAAPNKYEQNSYDKNISMKFRGGYATIQDTHSHLNYLRAHAKAKELDLSPRYLYYIFFFARISSPLRRRNAIQKIKFS